MPFGLGIMEMVLIVAVLGAISAVVARTFRHSLRRSARNEQLEARVRDLEDQLEEKRLHEQLRGPD